MLQLDQATIQAQFDGALHGVFTTPEDENEARRIVNRILGTTLHMHTWYEATCSCDYAEDRKSSHPTII